jgi:hypothetical protein
VWIIEEQKKKLNKIFIRVIGRMEIEWMGGSLAIYGQHIKLLLQQLWFDPSIPQKEIYFG